MLFDAILKFYGSDIGIDLGTCSTLVCIAGEGIILNEPSVVAVRKGTKQILNNGNAIGLEARLMEGKTPESISAIRPLKGGVISDFQLTEAMLSYFLRKVQGRRLISRPRVVIAIPSGITEVERRAVIDTAERAGARKVYLVDEPMAAGIGVGLPIQDPTASMIVDIGGGTTEVAVMSLGDIASAQSIRTAGDEMDEAIINHLKKTYNLLIGQASAERVKFEVGSAIPLDEELTMEVAGRDAITGMPRRITVTSQEVRDCLRDTIAEIIEAVADTLERTAPELAADLIDSGIHLCGGGALLRGLDVAISTATGLTATQVDDPLTAVARGTSVYIENFQLLQDSMQAEYARA